MFNKYGHKQPEVTDYWSNGATNRDAIASKNRKDSVTRMQMINL